MKINIEYIMFLDTEFISTKEANQPFQIGIVTYKKANSSFEKISEFSTYIRLKEGVTLNEYIKNYTQVDEVTIDQYGIFINDARFQLLNYLLEFPLQNTIIAGWSINNDKKMLNHLFNDEDFIFDIHDFNWCDIAPIYCDCFKIPKYNSPSLIHVCEQLELNHFHHHDALSDAMATAEVLKKLNELFKIEHMIKNNIFSKQKVKK